MTQAELAVVAERWRTRRNPDGTPVYTDFRIETVEYSRRALCDAQMLADAFVAGLTLPPAGSPSFDGKGVPGESD